MYLDKERKDDEFPIIVPVKDVNPPCRHCNVCFAKAIGRKCCHCGKRKH